MQVLNKKYSYLALQCETQSCGGPLTLHVSHLFWVGNDCCGHVGSYRKIGAVLAEGVWVCWRLQEPEGINLAAAPVLLCCTLAVHRKGDNFAAL